MCTGGHTANWCLYPGGSVALSSKLCFTVLLSPKLTKLLPRGDRLSKGKFTGRQHWIDVWDSTLGFPGEGWLLPLMVALAGVAIASLLVGSCSFTSCSPLPLALHTPSHSHHIALHILPGLSFPCTSHVIAALSHCTPHSTRLHISPHFTCHPTHIKLTLCRASHLLN